MHVNTYPLVLTLVGDADADAEQIMAIAPRIQVLKTTLYAVKRDLYLTKSVRYASAFACVNYSDLLCLSVGQNVCLAARARACGCVHAVSRYLMEALHKERSVDKKGKSELLLSFFQTLALSRSHTLGPALFPLSVSFSLAQTNTHTHT